MNRLSRVVVALAAVVAVAGTSSAVAASSRDSYVRHHLSFTQASVLQAGQQDGLSVNFVTPASWRPLQRTSKSHMSFRVGTTNCRYSVTVTTRLAEDSDETSLEHVGAALPVPASSYLLDEGVRNDIAAWRVTRLKVERDGGARVQLRAIRADHRSVGGGAWQETIISASQRIGDECHAGTYRNVLGPQIGDALATATGRAYSFAPKSR